MPCFALCMARRLSALCFACQRAVRYLELSFGCSQVKPTYMPYWLVELSVVSTASRAEVGGSVGGGEVGRVEK
jgi:hypothetical protein